MTSMVITLRLNSDKDADLIRHLEIVTPRGRSKLIRDYLREGFNQPPIQAALPQPVPEGKRVVLHQTPDEITWSYEDIEPIA